LWSGEPSTVVTELPTAADRVMIRTVDSHGTPLHLLTADAPIHSQVDLNATVGFVGLHLTGSLDECAQFFSGTTCLDPASSSTHLISVDFQAGLGDAQHDISLAAVFAKLASDPTSLVGITVHGQVKASISPDISGIPGLSAADFFGGTPSFTLSMDDITDPSTISFNSNGFSGALDKIKAFNFDTSNPKALFGEILQTLTMLSKTLKTISGDGSSPLKQVLDTKIPGVGITLGDVFNASEQGQGANVTYSATGLSDSGAHFTDDLIGRLVTAGTSTGMITATSGTSLTIKQWQGGTPAAGSQYRVENALESAIDMLTASPADNLQQLISLVNNRLGSLSVPITISVDTSGATPVLGMQIDWKRDFNFTAPIAFNFNLGSATNSIVGTQAKGLVDLHAQAEAKVKLLLDLSTGAEGGATTKSALQIDPANTSLSARIDGGASGYLKANFGPLNLALGEPVDSNPTHPADAKATFGISVGSHGTTPESLSSFVGDVASGGFQFNQGLTGVSCSGDTTPNLALCAAFPIYLSTDGGQHYKPVNTSGLNTDPPDTLRLRLPLSGDLSNEFALTDSSGNVLPLDPTDNTTPKRLDIPPNLLTDLQNAVLDFSQLGQGLDGYFKFAEQSLNLASFGGKLPLIGNDLQQGAQFLEHVQAQIDSKLGGLASVSDVNGLRDWVNNELNVALSGVLPAGSKVQVDFICSATLGTPTNVAGNAATAGSTHYLYRVSATTSQGTKESLASDPATDVTSAALSSTNTITVTWDKVDNADGYKVYRSLNNGTTWMNFDAAQADHPTFTDTGADGATATPTLTGSNPTLDPCPMTDLTGVTLTADIGQGKVSAEKGCEDQGADKCIGASVPLNIGVPGLSIAARTNSDGTPDASQNLSVKVGWRIHLKIGLDKNRGFFIETQDQKNPEIALGLAVSLPSTIDANITFLKIHLCDFATGESNTCPFTPLVPTGVTRTPGADTPLFAGEFGIDLHTAGASKTAFDSPSFTPNDNAANDIRLADLTNVADLKQLVTVGLSAKVHIDWDFQAQIDSSLPGVGGEFKLDWAWGTQLGGSSGPTVATDTGTDAPPPVDGTHVPNIEFDNVYITAGGFLSGVLKPIVQEVQKFTSPLKPVIDTLYAPIPVLSDLSHLAGGGDVTLITIAEAFSTLAGGPDLTMVERVLQVVKMINAIPAGSDNVGIFVGTFHVSGDKAINTAATPDNTNSMIGSQTPAPDSENGNKNVSDAMNGQSSGSLDTGKSKAGFSFPLLDHPASIFNLLMGGDVDLVRFDSGNLTLGFSYSQQFGPVYAPPPVVITISGSASVTARIIAGFDTYGLRKAYESIKSGQGAGTVVGNILDSLFLYTTDPEKGDGKPVPVLTLHGELAAGAAVTVLIVSVGLEGGISLTINFYWHDPDNDGKFRLSEFVAAALNNPLCLFDMDGNLSVFLRLYITFGFGPFSATFSFTLVDVTLLDFSYHPDCAPPPPELGQVQDHVLYLFFGALGSGHQRGDPWGNTGNDESVKVHELHDDAGAFTGFAVDGLNRHEEFLDPLLTTVVLDARGYAGKENLVIAGDSNQSQPVKDGPPPARPFDKTAIVYGGNNDDNIKIDGGTAYVDGGGGNDTINLAGNGNDYVAGGPGNDTVTVGNGNDTLAGDSSLPVTSSVLLKNNRQKAAGDKDPQGSWADVAGVPNGVGEPGAGEVSTDGNDSILAGYGANTIYGNGGDDTVSIATDKPLTGSETRQQGVNGASDNVIVGGTGNNNIHGGAANDAIYAGQQWPGGVTDPANYAGVSGDGNNQIDTAAGNDTVYGGSGSDFVVGHSVSGGNDTFYGGDGADILTGGNGADQIFGGPGNDYISGGPAKVDQISPSDPTLGDWKVTPTPDGQPVHAKLLVGGDGNDHIYGANSGDEIYGDRQEDKCVLPTSGPRSTPPAETNNGSPGPDYIVGGTGNNTINGGGGNDTIYAGTGNDLLCGGSGADKLYGGPGKDTLFGGTGNDLLIAGTGNSALYGNDGNDTIIAGSGNDWVEGNDGSDTIDGGTGQSVIIGGTSAEKQNDEGDTIFGGTGNNIIIGDNGTVDANSSWPTSGKPFVEPVVVHSFDLNANASGNTTYGGNDVITGGTGNDQIYGGLGDDYIVGGTGADHIEGGPGCDTIYGGSNNDDILGGTSPKAVAGGSVDGIPDGCDGSANDVTPATLGTFSPVIGNTIYGYLPYGANPNHANVIVGGNGSITPTGVTDPNDGAPVRTALQLALLTIGGNDTIHGGPGPDQIFGGLGDDQITTGNGENYVEGGPGADHIYGGTGSNDILGGTSPLTLPLSRPDALTTAQVSDGSNWIYADGLVGPPSGGAAQDGGNVVLGNNGCISRGTAAAPTDSNGCPTGPSTSPSAWQYSTADPTVTAVKGTLVRPVIRQLDVFDCPGGSCATPDVRGAGDHIWGGTGDDLLFGEVGNDEVYGGPPGTNGVNGTAGSFVGNDYIEGGAGSDTIAGGAGDDDVIGGSAPTYLPPGRTTAMISDGTSGGSGFTLLAPANALLSVGGSGVVGNTMDGGAGNDVMLGGNGTITHVLSSGMWARNTNDAAFIRTPVNLDLLTIGGDDTMRGGPSDDRMFGGLGNDNMLGGTGDDYLEGGPGRDVLQGSEGDDDLVGGTSPIALPPPPAGMTKDQVAAGTPDGTPDPANPGRLGNIVCGFLCGQSTTASDDDAIVANNGRIDRCPASVSGGVETAQGSDSCTWTQTSYGNDKQASKPAVAQSGAITSTALGNPRTRFVTLLGQSPTETTSNGNDYIEGDSGNDVIWGQDGNDAIHGDTPAANSPRLDECLPTSDPTAGQDIILGGYGNDVLCGDGGNDAVVGNRALVTVVPFSNASGAAITVGQNGGAPYGTFTYPHSGNTIYQVDLSKEYVNGVLTAVSNWNNTSATGQVNQHDIIFGGQGNDSLHGSPGSDFIEGDDGMHVAGQPAATGGDDIIFGDRGNNSIQGGPGNDHLYGSSGNSDLDVMRSDTAIALKVNDARACVPMAFPTITVGPTALLSAEGCTTSGFGLQSYASRFPLPAGSSYNSDPGLADNGGTTQNTTLFGDIMYGGFDRDVMQSENGGLGDRMIDDYGAYNLEYNCPASYGGYQINRSLSPALRTFLLALSQADGAVTTSTVASSGGVELSLIYASDSKGNTGPDYPTTPGHFTC
jgi:Ca2+-binding RTX toxin-like protein